MSIAVPTVSTISVSWRNTASSSPMKVLEQKHFRALVAIAQQAAKLCRRVDNSRGDLGNAACVLDAFTARRLLSQSRYSRCLISVIASLVGRGSSKCDLRFSSDFLSVSTCCRNALK